LFDLSCDLGQRTNVVDQHPERARLMEARLAEIEKGAWTQSHREGNALLW